MTDEVRRVEVSEAVTDAPFGDEGTPRDVEAEAPLDGDTAPLTFGERLREVIFGPRLTREERDQTRLASLSRAILQFPESPSNYLLRGELYLEIGEAELAAADFRQTLQLTETQVETNRWGIVAQGMQDRALKGLETALARVGQTRA